MYKRTAAELILRFSTIFPGVVINGPRQSGKTTLARTLFPHHPYVSFENFDVQEEANSNMARFVEKYAAGAIFDEIQHVPRLYSYLMEVIDSNRMKGRFILTRSQNFALNEQITQSLAGRVGEVTLLPLSYHELATPQTSPEIIFKGSYPALHKDNIHPGEFYPSYINTYIERDVRQIKNIENRLNFRRFLKLCAERIGKILDITSLANDCGIAQKTAQSWLSILEASYTIFLVQPYYKNFGKRLRKMPKLYFYDTGLAASLLNIESTYALERSDLYGHFFENLIVTEIIKERCHNGKSPSVYFWRDSNDNEIDLIGEWNNQLNAMEIKASTTAHPSDGKVLRSFANFAPNVRSFITYGGPQKEKNDGDIELLSIEDLWKICKPQP